MASLAESSTEGYGSKMAVLSMMMIMILTVATEMPLTTGSPPPAPCEHTVRSKPVPSLPPTHSHIPTDSTARRIKLTNFQKKIK
jgi:hypothetical protein